MEVIRCPNPKCRRRILEMRELKQSGRFWRSNASTAENW